MDQMSLYENDVKFCSELISVKYDGSNPLLSEHKIDALDLSISIGGYTRFLQSISDDLFNTSIQIVFVDNEDGSFKAVLGTTIKSIGLIGSICGILNFFGIDSDDIGTAVKDIQHAIVEEIKEVKGNIDLLISRIDNDSYLSDEEKEQLIEAMKNPKFREGLDDFTNPLDGPGYYSISVSNEEEETFSITKQDRKFFKYIPPAEEHIEFFDDLVEIIYLSPELNRWQFQGRIEFWADVLDQSFIDNTKNKKPSELRGVRFEVYGRKITTRKIGQKKRTITWIIDSVKEAQKQMLLPLNYQP